MITLFGSSGPLLDDDDEDDKCEGYFCSSLFHQRDGSFQPLLWEYASRQINLLLWLSLIAVTVFLLLKVAKLIKLWVKGNRIPGPPSLCFYGHTSLICRSNLIDVLSKSHGKFGPVVKLWLGPKQLLVSVKDPELVKEMLVRAEDKLPLTGRAFHLAFGRSTLFVSSFDKVEKSRNSLEAELNLELLDRAKVVSVKVVGCVMERINHIMTKGGLDCAIVSQYLAFTIVGASLFGDAFLDWSEAAIYEELMVKIAKDACFWASYSVTPFWKRGFWKYQHLCSKLKCLTQDIIQKGRQNLEVFCQMDKSIYDECGSFEAASASASASDPLNDATSDRFFTRTRKEPCGDLVSIMFHGSFTSAGLIGSILMRLVTNPEIQEKIYSEIVTMRSNVEEQIHGGVSNMPILLATIYESARLTPAGPLLQRCSLKHDVNLKGGITIPAGALLVVPVQLVQMDDSRWGSDANRFNPFRFLSKGEKDADLVHRGTSTGHGQGPVDAERCSYILNNPNENAAFLPFGSGARACIGQKLAILSVATLFASLLEQYEIRLQPGSYDCLSPEMTNSLLQFNPSPKMVFIKRNSWTNEAA